MTKVANAHFTAFGGMMRRHRDHSIKNYMRSKVATRIQNETPDEVRIFVRQYTDIVLRINQLLQAKGYTQRDLKQSWESRSYIHQSTN